MRCKALVVWVVWSVWGVCGGRMQAEEIGYIEEYALARDRTEALAQLIPGTEEFYYYHCLHFQNLEQFDRVEQLLQAWIQRYNYTRAVLEIQYRQALLAYSQHPRESLDFLQRTLNLQYNHQRQSLDARPDLPTDLDSTLLDRDRLTQEAWQNFENLDGFENAALDWLVPLPVPPERLRKLLERLERPDYPQLVALILEDLSQPGSAGFGSLPIHRQLLLAQLDEAVKLQPDLLNQSEFIRVYLARLRPTDDQNVQHDLETRQAYLDRLWGFVERLAPAHNSLKLHVLFHRLMLDRERGVFDKPRFLVYIQLPRNAGYVNPKYIEQDAVRQFTADRQADFNELTGLSPVGDDEPLIRSYLQHFFLTETTYTPYQQFLDDVYLKHTFAETKIVLGLGDAEQWSAMLPPEKYSELKQRVDLDFAFTNRRSFLAADPVTVDLQVKNVPTLIVKVYEINTFNYYQQNQREVNTDINLDGLVANFEQTHQYSEPSVRRVARHFEFPELTRPGVYVIDFIGNGKNSRAVIRKGQLRYLSRTSTVGHIVTILDEQNQVLPEASLWLAGHEYRAGTDGTIALPFSTQPGRQPIILSHQELSTLAWLDHQSENYELAAGMYVDREALLSRKTASLLVRPALRVNGTPVTLSVLENVRLVITSTDQDGVATKKEVSDFKLFEDREATYDFQVPPRLSKIQFVLTAQVQNLSLAKKVDLAVSEEFQLNGQDKTEEIQDLHLTNFGGRYVLELLGKTGEPRPHQAVHVTLKHRDFRRPVETDLQTDENGQVVLGPLVDIDQVTVSGPVKSPRTWALRSDRHSHPASLHGQAGTALEVPYPGPETEPERAAISLLELRGDQFVADRFDALKLIDGMLVISDLPAGDYDLWLKKVGVRIRIRMAAGEVNESVVMGSHRHLELRSPKPLHIKPLAVSDDALRIELLNADEFSRVHVFATRYEPAYGVCDYLGRIQDREPWQTLLGGFESYYTAGRTLGDEYRYIIDRKYAAKFPGNMLTRPSLLLNPWAIRSTETGQQPAATGEAFGPVPADAAPPSQEAAAEGEAVREPVQTAFLDFLAHSSAVLINLIPDESGIVTVDRQLLKPYQRVWVVAVDPDDTACRTVALPESERSCVDLRLARGLDPQQHFTQQKLVSLVAAGETFRVEDITTTRFEIYDSLAKVYALMVTLSSNPHLVEFGFLTNWDQLKPEEQRANYSKYACHELNYFLLRKDPAFFETVVLPFLKNKKDKTFLDHWLIGADLQGYLEPWKRAQLNVVERVLLAERLAEERPATSRAIADLVDVMPPDVDRFNFLFNTAVQGSALEAGKTLASRVALHTDELYQLGGAHALPSAAAGADASTLLRGGAAGELGYRMDSDAEGLAENGVDERTEGRSKRRLSESRDVVTESLGFFAGDRARKEEIRQLYRQLDKTQEWAENNYYQLPIALQNAALVPVNPFWRDYAAQEPQQPFRSTNVAEAAANFTEMMFALSALDLPLRSAEHEVTFNGPQMILTAKSPLIVFHEEIRRAELAADETPILVSQNFIRLDDRYRYVNNQQVDKYVTDEFLVQTVYGCQIVVTNPTSSPQKLTLLLQIPQGTIPVLNGHVTRGAPVDLKPFATTTIEYYFYFPQAGQFVHYPVHVAKNEQLLAAAPAVTLQAVEQLTRIDRQSWQYVSQNGSDEEVLDFLKTENLQRIDLGMIAFRMRDASFFQAATKLLAARQVYHPVLWSYAIMHDSPPEIRVFLQHLSDFVNQCGPYLDSPLLKIDPVARHLHQHLDYRPLVNARAHQLGQRRQILNDRLLQQYRSLLKILSYHRELNDDQLMAVTYYMLTQDRIEEALEFFRRVNPDQLPTRLQYDYFTAYLDFFSQDPQLAGPLVAQYADYPVDRWREAFQAVGQQLTEMQGQPAAVVDPEDPQQTQTQLAATEANFDLQVETKKITIRYQNLNRVRVNYYVMDIELLFSRNPFVQQYTGQFSTIRPNYTAELELPADATSTEVDLPTQLQNSNVLVEVTGGGKTRSQAYYANSLDVQVVENYGQIQVRHQASQQPLGKVYVKVYARMSDGRVEFYKDGYTDLRGRFDYTSLSTDQLDSVARFSLLIFSEENGAVIREADPPKR
ncbi:MAG: hypothetical protein ACYC6N_05975 [Pirellulaceae bacterium]